MVDEDFTMIITDNVTDVADIFSELALDDIEDILMEQLRDDRIGDTSEKDNFLPVYSSFKMIWDDPSVEQELKKQAQARYHQITRLFVDRISQTFNLTYDDTIGEYLYDIGTLAFFMYRFFVLDLFANINDVLHTYIEDNADVLAEVFEEYKGRKDAATISSKGYVPDKYVVVAANIPKVIRWVFEQLTPEVFMDNCDPEDVVVQNIKTLYEDGKLDGNFIDKLTDLYVNNTEFRSKLIIEVTFSLNFKK